MAKRPKRLSITECADIATDYLREIKDDYEIPPKDERPELMRGSGFAYPYMVKDPKPGIDYERDYCLIDFYEPKDPADDGIDYVEILVNRLTGEPELQYIRFPKK
jgi:hypothetical protein